MRKADIPQIELRDIHTLVPYAKNAKLHDKEQVRQIANSMIEFGWTVPVLADEMGIVAGHGRIMAADLLYREGKQITFPNGAPIQIGQAPVVDCTGWSASQRKAYILADNKLTMNGGWDEELLSTELTDLKDEGFDLSLTGFSDDELEDLLLDDDDLLGSGGETDEDEIPEVPEEPVSVQGDIWQLGRHRLMCGDSTSQADVAALMNGHKVDILFTDPPYGIDFKPQRGTHDKIMNDNLGEVEFAGFLDDVFACAKAVMKPDTYAFVWTGWPKIGAFEAALKKQFKLQALHIWVKNNFGIGYYSRPKHEPFYLCLNGKPVYPSAAPADVWEYARVHKTIHSCEKPVGLIESIMDTYHKNSLVLDLFGGSGSTLMACENTGRSAFLMELDPKYADLIITRWQNYTGQKAIHAVTGKPFTGHDEADGEEPF